MALAGVKIAISGQLSAKKIIFLAKKYERSWWAVPTLHIQAINSICGFCRKLKAYR
jgi:hypothetical protein